MSPLAPSTGSEEILWIDDEDMSRYGLWVLMPSGWADGPLQEYPGSPVAGRAGTQVVSSDILAGPREIGLPCRLICADWDELVQRLDLLKRLYEGAYVNVRLGGWPDREAMCRIRQIQVSLGGLPDNSDGGDLTIAVRADSPYMRARRFETYVVRPGMECPVIPGTAPSDIAVRVDGPANATINLRYYDVGGVERQKLVLSGAPLLLGESLYVDGESPYGEITRRNAAGIVTDAYNYLHQSGHYITVHPRWSQPEAGLYGYFTIDTGTAVIRMRRWFR